MISIRSATPDDAPALGRIHVDAWQAAYRGLMPDGYLDGLRPEHRAAGWEVGLQRDRARDPVLVAERDGEVAGFAALGPAVDPRGWGEVHALNVTPQHWGTGVGRALLDAACERLDALEYATAVLWVVPGNARARRFYEAGGWAADGAERIAEVLGVVVPELRYRRCLRIVG